MTRPTKSQTILSNVDWSIIRYANCWEDADFLLKQMNLSPGLRILSIASGGDNSLSLLTTDPEVVVTADINATQLYLLALKMAAIRKFSRAECLAFFGFTHSGHRKAQYQLLRDELDVNAKIYFDHHSEIIEDGIIHAGKLGKFFKMFAKYVLPIIHSKDRIDKLLASKSAEEQQAFFKSNWNNKRWRSFFKIAFSKNVLGKYGRDPAFFKQVEIPVADFILQQTQAHLQTRDCQQNPFLHYVLKGHFAGLLPHYLREENFALIKSRLARLQLWQGPVESAIQQYGRFNAFNLSNIFEYLDVNTCSAIANQLFSGAYPNAKLAYWNLMVDRQLSQLLPQQFQCIEQLASQQRPTDNGFFYKRFMLDIVNPKF